MFRVRTLPAGNSDDLSRWIERLIPSPPSLYGESHLNAVQNPLDKTEYSSDEGEDEVRSDNLVSYAKMIRHQNLDRNEKALQDIPHSGKELIVPYSFFLDSREETDEPNKKKVFF